MTPGAVVHWTAKEEEKRIRRDERKRVLGLLTGISNTKLEDFMDWLADRLVYVYHENPNTDFVLSLRHRANAARELRRESGDGK